jgi:ribosomal protein S18 acetylase RimI-like enzyme
MKKAAGNTLRHLRSRAVEHRESAGASRSGDDFVIRPAETSDIAAISALDARITSISKKHHWQDLLARSKSRDGAQFFLVADAPASSKPLLGFIVGEIRAWEFGSAPSGWVYALSVEPAVREHGVGEALLAAIEEEFKRCKITKMRTMVAKDNPLPMLFFRAEGMMAGPYIQLEKDLN